MLRLFLVRFFDDIHIQHDTSLLEMSFSSLDFGERLVHRTLKMAQFPWNGLWIMALEAKTSEDVDRPAESTKKQAGWGTMTRQDGRMAFFHP